MTRRTPAISDLDQVGCPTSAPKGEIAERGTGPVWPALVPCTQHAGEFHDWRRIKKSSTLLGATRKDLDSTVRPGKYCW